MPAPSPVIVRALAKQEESFTTRCHKSFSALALWTNPGDMLSRVKLWLMRLGCAVWYRMSVNTLESLRVRPEFLSLHSRLGLAFASAKEKNYA